MEPNPRINVIIPARGGSKGIPRKNLKPFNGKPLLVHSIDYGLACKAVCGVYVSTEDAEIAEVATGSGARVIQRPAEIAGDTATTESAIAHACEVWDEQEASPDIIVLLQATSPLRPAGSLEEAIRHFLTSGCDSLLSLSPTHRFFWRIRDGVTTAEYDFAHRPRRQDLQSEDIRYVENGSLYLFTRDAFLASGNRLSGRIGHITFPEEYSYEIDTEADFAVMEALAHQLEL